MYEQCNKLLITKIGYSAMMKGSVRCKSAIKEGFCRDSHIIIKTVIFIYVTTTVLLIPFKMDA